MTKTIQERLARPSIILMALFLNYQIMMRFLFLVPHYQKLQKQLMVSQQNRELLKENLFITEQQSLLFQNCSVAHESRARYKLSLKKENEIYIPFGAEFESKSEAEGL